MGLPLFFSLDLFWWPFAGSIWLSSLGLVLLSFILSGMAWTWISFLFLLSGGSGVLSHRAYLGDILFFVGSLLQRRKIHSDFVGLTSPRGGKGPYISFLTLRPGLLLCSDLYFFCNHGIQHTHTHTLFPARRFLLFLGGWPTFLLIVLQLLDRF